MLSEISDCNDYLQLCRKETWRIIFISENIIAFINSIKQQKCVADTEQSGKASSNKSSRRRARGPLHVFS